MCLLCGQSTKPAKNGVCETCIEEYETIRSYIVQHPSANLMEISNATKISIKRINQFVDKGKFILIPKDE
jgi:NMD protein affecting ribosome stability and mRNA decay